MKKVNQLKKEYNEAIIRTSKLLDKKRKTLSVEMTKMFHKNKVLQHYINQVENSKELTYENDEFASQYITNVDLSNVIDLNSELDRELLNEYLPDKHSITVDYKNHALLMSIGPAIVITDTGHVHDQDSNKFIINKEQYTCDAELIELIRAYMDEKGYFPAILKQDKYGNIKYVKGV